TSDVGPPAPLQIQPSVLPDYTASARTFPQSLTPANAFGSTPVSAGGHRGRAEGVGGRQALGKGSGGSGVVGQHAGLDLQRRRRAHVAC
ncbi:hypothetical protein, partial [Brevundimonas sp. BAL450]|uniref:hypothetical protein n=1 Tax=Brevundimonas sp. BAL450 TaxID=1708162 RepID=UPI001E60BEEA